MGSNPEYALSIREYIRQAVRDHLGDIDNLTWINVALRSGQTKNVECYVDVGDTMIHDAGESETGEITRRISGITLIAYLPVVSDDARLGALDRLADQVQEELELAWLQSVIEAEPYEDDAKTISIEGYAGQIVTQQFLDETKGTGTIILQRQLEYTVQYT